MATFRNIFSVVKNPPYCQVLRILSIKYQVSKFKFLGTFVLLLLYMYNKFYIKFIFQIAMKNGVIQNWGLVEFFDSDSAEMTQSRVQGRILNGHTIRVSFCIPGVNAINIYMAVVNAKDDVKTKKALLEDAPSSSVYTQLQKLSAQNPACKLKMTRLQCRHPPFMLW